MNATIMGMNTTMVIIVAAAIILVAVAIVAATLISRRRQSGRLQSRFGPEYARAVEASGDRGHAEAELQQRAKRVAGFDIRPLPAADRNRYFDSWSKVQAQFVDNPKDAVVRADELVGQVMEARGYPVTDFDQRSADLSVDHPQVVQNYRAAHDIALAQERGEASTEDLRQAMIHYRSLFDELVGQPEAAPEQQRQRESVQ